MTRNNYALISLVTLMLFAAMVLTIVPLPHFLIGMMPQWALLVVLWVVVQFPDKLGVIFAFCFGLLMDVLTGSLLGQHAFVYVFLVYCVLKLQLSLRHLPMWQQMLMVLMFSFLNLSLQRVIIVWVGHALPLGNLWVSIFTSALVWPLLTAVLHKFHWQRIIE